MNQPKKSKGASKMKKAIFKKICLLSILCIAMMSFLIHVPMTCYGDDEPCPLRVDVSPYQVNIDSGGAEHYVRVLTYTSYSNTAAVFVYINDNEDAIDPGYIVLTRDSVGHLVVKIDLDALQLADLWSGSHDLTIAVTPKFDEDCVEYVGMGEIQIVDKKGF
jgi:hypothetical protein